jgi:hypothetical protein
VCVWQASGVESAEGTYYSSQARKSWRCKRIIRARTPKERDALLQALADVPAQNTLAQVTGVAVENLGSNVQETLPEVAASARRLVVPATSLFVFVCLRNLGFA